MCLGHAKARTDATILIETTETSRAHSLTPSPVWTGSGRPLLQPSLPGERRVP